MTDQLTSGVQGSPAAGSPFRDRLVVVIGTNRSGTTWLSTLLQAHREVGGTNDHETELFSALAGIWRTAIAQGFPADPLAAHLRTFCDEILGHARQDSPRPLARFFVEKTPGTAFYLPYVRLLYPDAWFVRIVRDGRDVARSMRRRNYGTRSDLANIHRWARHEEAADRNLAGVSRVITVRYEDLYTHTVQQLMGLYSWLGLTAYPGLIREIARRSARQVAPFSKESSVGPGKWRTDVSRRRLGLMYAGADKTLKQHGYISDAELDRWHRRPEYWAGVGRRKLMERGIATHAAVRVFNARPPEVGQNQATR
jgi:hypothetical protein